MRTRTVIGWVTPVVLGLAACQAREAHLISSVHPADKAITRASAVTAVELPTRTTVQEPYLGKQLDPGASLSSYFTSNAALRNEHELARRLVDGVRQAIQARRWHLEIRTGCPVEYDGNVIVEGRALVRDGSGNVRAYSQDAGTGDSAGTWKLYYDTGAHLRLAVFQWASNTGLSTEGIALFDGNGRLERCSYPPDRAPPWPCEPDVPDQPGLDPDVAGAIRPEMQPAASSRTEPRCPIGWAVSLDPTMEWSKCEVPYRPHR